MLVEELTLLSAAAASAPTCSSSAFTCSARARRRSIITHRADQRADAGATASAAPETNPINSCCICSHLTEPVLCSVKLSILGFWVLGFLGFRVGF